MTASFLAFAFAASSAFAAEGAPVKPELVAQVIFNPGTGALDLVEAGEVTPVGALTAARVFENSRGLLSAEVGRSFGPLHQVVEDRRAVKKIDIAADPTFVPANPIALLVDDEGAVTSWLVSSQRDVVALIVGLEGELHLRALEESFTDTVLSPAEVVVGVVSSDPRGGFRAAWPVMEAEEVVSTLLLLNPVLAGD